MKKITLKYWQKTYLATLALFLCCLTGSIGAVFSLCLLYTSRCV